MFPRLRRQINVAFLVAALVLIVIFLVVALSR